MNTVSIDRAEAYAALCAAAAPAFEGEGGLSMAQKGCIALAVNALESRRELELLLAGTRRSVRAGNRSDLCFRILQKTRAALLASVKGPRAHMIQNVYGIMREEWLKNRLSNFVLSGKIEDYPEFFRAGSIQKLSISDWEVGSH